MFILDSWDGLLRLVFWMAPTRPPKGEKPLGGNESLTGGSSGGEEGERFSSDQFEEIFKSEFETVLGYFRRRGFPYEDALELTQETFLRVYKYSGRFRGDASVKTWIYQIAESIGHNDVRRVRTKKREGNVVSLEKAAEDGIEIPLDRRPEGWERETGILEDLLAAEKRKKLYEVVKKWLRECAAVFCCAFMAI